MDYQTSMKLMAQAFEKAREEGSMTLLGFEYERVITLGLRATQSDKNYVLCESTEVQRIHRGGLATLHNQGQCVIYPITPFKKLGFTTRHWVEFLLLTTSKTLKSCNIIVVSQEAGIFTQKGKIASIGLGLKEGVSTHGIAVNISNNLIDFNKIIPCGTEGQIFDKVSEYKDVHCQDFFNLWCQEFQESLLIHAEHTLTKPPKEL